MSSISRFSGIHALKKLGFRVATKSAAHEDHITREQHASQQIERFQEGVIGGGVALSRLASSAPFGDSLPIAGFLSERRDTQGLAVTDAAAQDPRTDIRPTTRGQWNGGRTKAALFNSGDL